MDEYEPWIPPLEPSPAEERSRIVQAIERRKARHNSSDAPSSPAVAAELELLRHEVEGDAWMSRQ